ncbi:hypothetical protein CcrC1_gp089 [Caulobacter phage C1]|nr:hypothetical protein CcrC1_gp089 [Caulobacter phage C1]UTU08317.1 hypothetical protein CcrC2_gp089 [Caulobacter phage C2]UTU08838.1 hypothetical protein CcrJ4_gp087 [Caulobacter phage J4]UTU09391.1 hypothetical protein CcrBL47_gp105 [Caulobacter phage BL47]UTU09951.1 hypothetical protein CcrRB23_gp089 [Caulobacter phage RB23]WGN96976.1 hypothetical protein [Bertelyvirus sp.]
MSSYSDYAAYREKELRLAKLVGGESELRRLLQEGRRIGPGAILRRDPYTHKYHYAHPGSSVQKPAKPRGLSVAKPPAPKPPAPQPPPRRTFLQSLREFLLYLST